MNRAVKYVIDLLYPNRCPCCNNFIKWDELICSGCIDELKVSEEFCKFCGKVNCICKNGINYDRAYICYSYEGKARNGIIALKESRGVNFAEYIGNLLSGIISKQENDKFDYIVPVPMSKNKKILRGYNQSEIIAKEIGKNISVPMLKVLISSKQISTQHMLTGKERSENVKMISVKDADLSGKKIILCDDVITTASTVNRCSELLKSCGAEKVIVAAGASTVLKNREFPNPE